jgi:hypothetical protein
LPTLTIDQGTNMRRRVRTLNPPNTFTADMYTALAARRLGTSSGK